MTTQTESPTRLHGRWLLMARVTWVALAILTLTIVVIALPDRYDALMLNRVHYTAKHSLEQLGLSIGFYTAYNLALDILRVLVSTVVALFIFWRKSDDWMALFISLTLLFVGPFWISASYSLKDALIKFHPALLPAVLWDSPVEFLRALSWGCFILFFYLFPNGRLLFPWMRVLAVWVLTWPFFPASRPYMWPFIDPLTVFLILFGLGVWTQIYRYSRLSSPLERQQTKWAIFGLAIAISIPFAVYLLATINPSLWLPSRAGLVYFLVGDTLITLSSLLIPLTISNSILRYRLWDIDIFISRTLVYGALTASVVAVYVLIVGGFGMLFQTRSNLLGIILALLLITFLFQPLRRWLQSVANRLVPVPQIFTAEPIATQHPQAKHEQIIAVSQYLPHTTLRGSRLIILRVIWVITALLVFGFIAAGVPNRYLQLTTISPSANTVVGQLQPEEAHAFEQNGLPIPIFAAYITTLDILVAVAFALIGLVIAWFRPEDRMALLLSIGLISAAMVVVAAGMFQSQWRLVVLAVHAVWGASVIPTLYLFPDGRFVPRWTRWLSVIWLMYTAAWLIFPSISPPFAFGRGFTGYEFPRNVWLLLWGCSGLGAQMYRYLKVSGATQRQQIKWVVFGFAIGLIALATGISLLTVSRLSPLTLPTIIARLAGISILLLGTLVIPSSIGVSILRYHLFDVDIIINRTLVYGALTGVVVGTFVVLVGFLSTLFQSSGNSIIAILATGLVALFFNPVRQRLQSGVNRLMYGERDEPYVVLSQLGQRLETVLAPHAILSTIVETIGRTLKLPFVEIRLSHDQARPVSFGEVQTTTIAFPLTYQNETLGQLHVAPRAGESLTSADHNLLKDLARQTGIAIHAAQVTVDLQRSRERLVLAREEERRRLRRDLHDDLGPTLASLGLAASTAADLIPTNPTTATKLVKELESQIRATVGNIRRLVYDLRPPSLDELGLLPAVRERASRYSNAPDGFHVTVDAPVELPALPAAVEVAAYRIVQEALENASKHSQARQCAIRFVNHNGLEIEITDDGIGLPPNSTPGVGLRSMRERSEELGGSCVIERGVNGGTRILARLPIGGFDGSVAHLDRG